MAISPSPTWAIRFRALSLLISIQFLSTCLIFGQMPGLDDTYTCVLRRTVPRTACIGDYMWMTSGARISNTCMVVMEMQKGLELSKRRRQWEMVVIALIKLCIISMFYFKVGYVVNTQRIE